MINGVFNNRMTDNWSFLTLALDRLFRATKKGLAFNCLSTYVDYRDEHLYYADPRSGLRFL